MRTSTLINLTVGNACSYHPEVSSDLNSWLSSCIDPTLEVIEKYKKNFQRFDNFFDSLPKVKGEIVVKKGVVTFLGPSKNNFELSERISIENRIMQLVPWRKGPFKLFGLPIQSEWNCNFKWQRLVGQLPSIENDAILDVGSGYGYFAWRMRANGARFVACLEPNFISFVQYHFLNFFSDDIGIRFVPVSLENSPRANFLFDKVFMMGTLYHTKNPFEHLKRATSFLKQRGYLILETLIFESDKVALFVPKDKYALMPNVWHIPSFLAIKKWLCDLGYLKVDLIDVDTTSQIEQSSSLHMPYKSLSDGIDHEDRNMTVELYPRPKRGIILAQLSGKLN